MIEIIGYTLIGAAILVPLIIAAILWISTWSDE